jgi:hypothetical protein
MKTFREFLSEDAVKAQKAWQDWMKANPQEFGKGGRFYERGSTEKTTQAAKDFMKGYMKTGKAPAGFEVKTTKVSGQDVRGTAQTPPKQQQAPRQEPPKATQTPPKQPSGSTQTPPRGAQTGTQAPPKQPKASTPPPPKPPTSNAPAPTAKPPTAAPKGPGLRSSLGKFVDKVSGPAVAVSSGVADYKERRAAGQSKVRSAGGAVASGAGWSQGASLGFKMTPGPLPVKLVGAAAGGFAGKAGANAAYDFAADKSRPARQAVSKATGFDKFQQKNALIKQGSGLQKAQQTVDTRSARAASSSYGAKKGSALTGIGGKTVVSKDKKGSAFMSTGAGKQRQTVQLSKTQLVRDPKTGKQVVGDLAFKGGKATYLARPSVASRDTSLGARVGRALNIGRYSKAAEQQAAKQEYRTALKNTQTYQKKLGITPKAATAQKLPARGAGPAKVGPKLVGPKIVGPKKVGPTKPQSPTKSLIKPA